MTRLISFSIEGLAGHDRSTTIDLDPSLNVFWGLNGSGKTTLLRILHAALDNDASIALQASFRRASVNFHSEQHAKVIRRTLDRTKAPDDEVSLVETVEGELVHVFSEAPVQRWATSPRLRGETNGRFRHVYLPTSRMDMLGNNPSGPRAPRVRPGMETSYDAAFAEVINSLWIRLSNDTLSEQRTIQQRGLAEILRLSLTGVAPSDLSDSRLEISADDGYDLFKEFMLGQHMDISTDRKRFIKRYEEDPAQRLAIELIRRVNADLARAAAPLTDLAHLVESMFLGNKHLEYLNGHLLFRPHSGDLIPLSSLSSGEKQLILLLLECLSAAANVVLIDEPELSLHVDWQRRLIGAIRDINPNVQLVLATHSPEIVACVPDSQLFEL